MFETVYKGDRQWSVMVDGCEVTTASGKVGGKLIMHTYKATPKNVGKANETTAEAQAILEAESLLRKKVDREGYCAVAGILKPFRPMLARDWSALDVKPSLSDQGDLYVQPKLDGVRAWDNGVSVFSRRNSRFCESVSRLDNVILDGEWYHHSLSFEEIISKVKLGKFDELEYHIFDAYFPEKPDLTFGERWDWLSKYVMLDPQLRLVDTIKLTKEDTDDLPTSLDVITDVFTGNGYEGTMLRLDTPYEPDKRSKGLWKIKKKFTKEYLVYDILLTEKEEVVVDFKSFTAAITGSKESQMRYYNDRSKYVRALATVEFQEYTAEGKPRFPKVITMRDYE